MITQKKEKRTKRLDIRVTPSWKKLIARAIRRRKMRLTDWVEITLLDAANEILRKTE